MRSIQLLAPRRLEDCSLADPRDPGPGEVLVKLRAVGLCGSDLHWYLDGRIGRNPAVYPQVLGHEPVGEVIQCGPGARFSPGDRVVIEPTLSCGHCEYCLAGFHNNCVSGVFMGGPQAHGFFLQYAVVPASNAMLVPDSLGNGQATLIEPVAVMAHMLDLVRIRPGDTVAITGAGPIGMLCAAMAHAAGASRVYICDRVHHRLELAMRMGADIACDPEALAEVIADETRGRGVDVALEAAGAPAMINLAFAVTRPSGSVALIGLTSEVDVPLDLHSAMGKELTIQTVKRSNHCSKKAIELLRRGVIPDALITHTMPLERTPDAFEMLANYAGGVGKIVIEINS
jgi:L-iditol 2-dehydrogenase